MDEQLKNVTVRIADIVGESVVDGDGIRLTLFTQGCPHHCKECHNAQTWDFNGGKDITLYEIAERIKKNPLLDGITLSGGEPFEQSEKLIPLLKWLRERGYNVWAYSGYTLENLLASEDVAKKEMLNHIDVLVDGPFVAEKKDLTLKFRGSSNQRIIDVNLTRKNGYKRIIIIE